jgi:hypothetical protein
MAAQQYQVFLAQTGHTAPLLPSLEPMKTNNNAIMEMCTPYSGSMFYHTSRKAQLCLLINGTLGLIIHLIKLM